MDPPILKRVRSRNFTEGEKKLFLEIVQPHLSKMKNKSWKCKNKEWQNVYHEFNRVSTFGFRTWKQLRTLYENMNKRKLIKRNNENKITAAKIDTTVSLLNPGLEPPEQVNHCNDSKNVYYEDLPVIIETVSNENIKQEADIDTTINDSSECNYSCVFETVLPDSEQCLTFEESKTNFMPAETDSTPQNEDVCIEKETCEKVIFENAIYEQKLKEMKELHEQKLKEMQEIHEHELKVIREMYEYKIRVKKELYEQELFTRKEDHALKIDVKKKLFKLKSKNWAKKNRILDLEIELKEKQLKQ